MMDIDLLPSPDLKCRNYEELLSKLAEILLKKGYVKKSYPKALIEREKRFPTGLELKEGVNIAIPHADAEHVKKSAILIAKLSKPVIFSHMVESEKKIPVDVVFLLAIDDPHRLIKLLRELATMFQDPDALKKIKTASSSKEIIKFLKERFKLNNE
ncbi:MAG: PTS sugar transporter subunit IIA [Thermoprotei archaeon]|nr:MAG: PTS sugar transporter subunit IIA [Thermoprotei archaeon]